jgi:hypothetical protein
MDRIGWIRTAILPRIRLAGPWTLADAICEISAPLVWRGPFEPVDFGLSKSQEVDSVNLGEKPARIASDPGSTVEITGTRHLADRGIRRILIEERKPHGELWNGGDP